MLGVYKYCRQSRAWLTVKYTFPNFVKSITGDDPHLLPTTYHHHHIFPQHLF